MLIIMPGILPGCLKDSFCVDRKVLLLSLLTIFTLSCQRAEIRVMSYNIRYGKANDGEHSWEHRRAATPVMLREVKPVVFGVQEALDYQIDYILEQCPEYKSVGVGREDGISEGEHMSVFYDSGRLSLLDWGTYWLSETPDVPSKGWDARCKRTATWTKFREVRSGKEFFFVNTHLDHRGAEARKEGLSLIYTRIQAMNPSGLPMVLLGDFNVMPDDECLTDISALMKNARLSADKADTGGSYHGYGKESQPIDYIFYKGFRRCRSFRIVTESFAGCRYISDHYPIYADIML